MIITKGADSKKLIPTHIFAFCLLDGLSKEEINKKYTRNDLKRKSCYTLDKFNYHLKIVHSTDIKRYCIEILKLDWPKCPKTNEYVGFKIDGRGINLSTYFGTGHTTMENSPKFAAFCEKMKTDRLGAGNPMFGGKPWNKGLDITTSETLRKMGEAQKGKVLTVDHKNKLKEARRLSPLKARHTQKHSPETVEKMRETTAYLWSIGTFSGRKTSIEYKMGDFLAEIRPLLKIDFVEQHQLKYFTFDYALPDAKFGIECQGSWYHVDPRLYPNGPTHAIQRRNLGRDKSKRKYAVKNGWEMFEIWETEINNGEFKNILLCRLKELNLLKESEPSIPSILK